jgi:hypothetical protein
MTKTTLLLLILFAIVPNRDLAGAEVRLTGIYSDLRYIDEAGDLLGYEVMIVASHDGLVAVVQVSEGYPARPEVVPLKVKGAEIEFVLQDGLQFSGKVTQRGLSGSFKSPLGGTAKVFLKRGRSYWQ